MSTFDGIVAEFPDIRIDFFRKHADASPPLACFLSHVHSDHLAGLESLRSPFVYCSAATREMLLRLERYPCRINYAKGVLEARQQTYKHLGRVLKPLPLETPTTIELRPGYRIQVTLFDANHCPGAVMFLIEGHGKSVLYTGDVRSEPWFVDCLARNPILIEYTCGLKTLDKLYLDTSFTADVPFQTKSEGIAELLRTVSRYPRDTVFHFQAWTYGYEDVWIALSKALQSAVHVDDYKFHLYGHMCGNMPHPGCLTSDTTVRLHSCEKGNMCAVASAPGVVTIQPIIARLANGQQLAEAGVGGGGEDLEREAELTCLFDDDAAALADLISACNSMTDAERDGIMEAIRDASARGRELPLNLAASILGQGLSADLETALCALPHLRPGPWPQIDTKQWIAEGISVESLFGQLCSGQVFQHDLKLAAFAPRVALVGASRASESQMADSTPRKDLSFTRDASPLEAPSSALCQPRYDPQPLEPQGQASEAEARIGGCDRRLEAKAAVDGDESKRNDGVALTRKRKHDERAEASEESEDVDGNDSQQTEDSLISTLHVQDSVTRTEAYYRMLGNAADGGCRPIPLMSTDGHNSKPDEEL
ncbi:beta-lactamase superfamily domain-containing protein [Hirsutella rhossiliensis]|uniref:Beta-lactamase superfamily domain-containing protein n=1 Tax=Hirsutella rhossiliensis TaxID=111463 RepID=A0A9P8MM44_9HYPO|nr:beta-lactamase superfamily domain-containing protein [Hirsutella rhossiliensis]KAH0957585.1 beta-lactamase superfamily domain-containing protein [Hirsutella rhossiliensis]